MCAFVCNWNSAPATTLCRNGWKFASADKEHCVAVATMAGHAPTYTELLTCLELAHEVRKTWQKSERSG